MIESPTDVAHSSRITVGLSPLLGVYVDKCYYCPNEAEYKALVEDDENPLKHHTEDICGECLHKIKYKLIESWTKSEWLALE